MSHRTGGATKTDARPAGRGASLRVLLTNDDGIASPGLLALARAISRVAAAFVVAPEHERSAASHAITLHKPLRATRVSRHRRRAGLGDERHAGGLRRAG